MSPSARRILIPLIVGGIATAVVIVGIVSKPARPAVEDGEGTTPPAAVVTGETAADPGPSTGENGAAPSDGEQPAAEAPEPPEAAPGPETAEPAPEAIVLDGLRAIAPDNGTSGRDVPAQPLGSTDPIVAKVRLDFSRAGAGIARWRMSNIWETAGARTQADTYYDDLAKGRIPPSTPPPSNDLRYLLQEEQTLTNRYRGAGFAVPILAAIQVEIDGVAVNLFDYNLDENGDRVYIWAETGPGAFETGIVDGTGTPIARITRRFTLGANYEITLEQRLENLTAAPLDVRWTQYGPPGLRLDRSRYMDRRRFRFGYLPDPAAHPDIVLAEDEQLLERAAVLKRWKKAEEAAFEGNSILQTELLRLWPNEKGIDNGYELSWFGSTNRYFTITVHPLLDDPAAASRALSSIVDEVRIEISLPGGASTPDEKRRIFTNLVSPNRTVPPGETLALDLGVYGGPLDRHILDKAPPYPALGMQHLILYQMSSMCAFCTFQWLAVFLLWFLTLLHNYVLFDWGLAIIGLVLVVRTILHPLTKRSQISMQRFGKAMGEMKPELDKLQKKYPGDAKKLQQEQMRLMRERGANPLQMLGCLPMFLQTPIWIALYAMLYFVFDLRQEPAFFGLFQTVSGGHWPFLADLSASDHFFGTLAQPRRFLMWNITGINVLPILMGGIFYVQQKYMSPPPSPTMTEDQLRQQKIMKVLMVVMFPLMLYSAPSGLTLYILTSSTIGIFESRYIRAHIKEMDLKPPKKKKPRGQAKPKDAQGRAYAAAMARAEERRRQKQLGPEKRYKKKRR